MIREHIAWYARPYLNSEYTMEPEGRFGFDFFPLMFLFEYTNLQHAPIKLDVSKMAINFTAVHDY